MSLNVNSAGIFRERYSRRKPIVTSLPTIGSNSNAETAEVNHGQNRGATVTSGNSSMTYAGKVNTLSAYKQEPYATLNDIRQKSTSSEGGDASISHADNSAPAISLESRDDALNSDDKVTNSASEKQKGNAESSAFDLVNSIQKLSRIMTRSQDSPIVHVQQETRLLSTKRSLMLDMYIIWKKREINEVSFIPNDI